MKKNITNYLFLTLLLLGLCFLYTGVQAAELAGRSIEIVIGQVSNAAPTLNSVSLTLNNPDRYMVVLPNKYFTVKEFDKAGTVLYEGQVKKTRHVYSGPVIPPATHPEYIELPDNPLIINFPYFEEAHRIKIFDEAGALVFDIDLTKYGLGPTPTPALRFADCNKCGYCANQTKQPADLDKCMACLYPDYVTNPNGTLSVDPLTNQPVQPRIGAYYSQLGCVDVGIAGFRDASAAGGVTNTILTRLLFPITGVLSFLALVYGAFLVITAQGNVEQIQRGKKWIYGAIIGVAFTFMSILLIRIIGGDILKIPGFDL